MTKFHLLEETPTNSGTFTETSEVIDSTVDGATVEDAKLRCIDLSQDGNRYGFWIE